MRQDDGNYQLTDGSTATVIDSTLNLSVPGTLAYPTQQEWTIEPTGDGYFSIQNVYSGLFLSGGAGSPLSTSSAVSEWIIQPLY